MDEFDLLKWIVDETISDIDQDLTDQHIEAVLIHNMREIEKKMVSSFYDNIDDLIEKVKLGKYDPSKKLNEISDQMMKEGLTNWAYSMKNIADMLDKMNIRKEII